VRRRPSPAVAAALAAVAGQALTAFLLYAVDPPPPLSDYGVVELLREHRIDELRLAALVACSAPFALRHLRPDLPVTPKVALPAAAGVALAEGLLISRWASAPHQWPYTGNWPASAVGWRAFLVVPGLLFVAALARSRLAAVVLTAVAAAGLCSAVATVLTLWPLVGPGVSFPNWWRPPVELALLTVAASAPLAERAAPRAAPSNR
jgi:hypothetical protein